MGGKIWEECIGPEIFLQLFLENTVCQSSIIHVSFSSPSVISLARFLFPALFYKAAARYCLTWVSAGGVTGSQIP